uniref:Uncharacterized protein n=1 Tax=Arundo donax TaxID=35708 RepID=A0A0A9A6Y2_ARUDO
MPIQLYPPKHMCDLNRHQKRG